MNLPNLAYGEQDFRQIRERDNYYIDKTHFLEKLLDSNKSRYYFLSRPRRFGKTLTLSTLKYLFNGEKEIFEGLAIERNNIWKWETHPVIHLDFNKLAGKKNEAEFNRNLIDQISDSVLTLEPFDRDDFQLSGLSAPDYLAKTLRILTSEPHQQVVILIDEYDALLTENLGDPVQFEYIRQWLQSFYSILKSYQPKIRFLFITGITRFAKTGLFSSLNYITDLSFSSEFHNLCGFTHEEMINNFGERLELIRAELYPELTFNEFTDYLKTWYNGFSWNGKDTLYSPASILQFCREKKFINYWSLTGRTQTVSRWAADYDFDALVLAAKPSSLEELEIYNFSDLNKNITGLLWQMGYLTVSREFNSPEDGVKYLLDFPNKEVRNSFNSEFLRQISTGSGKEPLSWCDTLKEGFMNADFYLIERSIAGILASLPYDDFINGRNRNEGFYRSILYVALQVFGSDKIRTEVHSRAGRVDLLLKFHSTVWVLELKYDKKTDADAETLAQTALYQIKQKAYYKTLDAHFTQIYLSGIGVSDVKADAETEVPISVKIKYESVG